MSQCPRCGAEISADMNFCGVCGEPGSGGPTRRYLLRQAFSKKRSPGQQPER